MRVEMRGVSRHRAHFRHCDCRVAFAPRNDSSVAIHDPGLHGLPRFARSDDFRVQGRVLVLGRNWRLAMNEGMDYGQTGNAGDWRRSHINIA